MRIKAIAVCANSHGAGKTTFANFVVNCLYRTHWKDVSLASVISFAAPLKNMARILCAAMGVDLDSADKEKPLAELFGRSPRYLYRTLGLDWGRKLVHPDLWTRCLLLSAERHARLGGVSVVDDMRYKNEYDALKAAKVVTVYVNRPDCPEDPEEPKEITPEMCDVVIQNTGTLKDLEQRAKDFTAKYVKGGKDE